MSCVPPSPLSSFVGTTLTLACLGSPNSGALATGSVYRFLAQPSLRSTGFFAVGLGGASLFYLGGKGTSFGLEDGPKLGACECHPPVSLPRSIARAVGQDRQ